MSVRHTNATTQKISRGGSIPSNKTKLKPKPTQTKKPQNKDSKLIDKKRNIKVDYNSNNYFYNDEDYGDEYPYHKVEYYEKNQKGIKYNNETNDSYVTVEQEDGRIKYVPKNYVEYKRSSRPVYQNNKEEYYEENSEDSENNYNNENDNVYYDNEDEYEQDLMNNQRPGKGYKYQVNKYYLTQDNNSKNNKIKKIKKNNQNVITRPINHQINFTKDLKRKGRTPGGNLHNCGNNTTTTNNTYNNNIYYINPINVKNKNKKEEANTKMKKANANKTNAVYKNVDLTINTKKPMREIDYFRMNRIERSQRPKYTKAAILIQSIFRGYLIKIKLYNNVNLYVCCKRSIDILENLFSKKRRMFWKFFKNKISRLFYDDLLNTKVSLNILKEYLKTNKTNSKEKRIASFHKELGDSFNIVVDNRQKENTERKLKSKLNDIIKENTELKNQLEDNKNIEEKMKNLIDENKKNQNINAIIMKDNQQLAKKLKDIQDYRNTNLFVENQSSVDLTQKQLQIEELIKNNEINLSKLKKYLLRKIINKKINQNKYSLKDKFNKYRNIVEKIKNKELEKNINLKAFFEIIKNKYNLLKQKYFWNLYYITMMNDKEIKSKNKYKNEILKILVNKKEKNNKIILYKSFFKYYTNTIKSLKENSKKEEEQHKQKSKKEILNNIFKKYQKDQKLLYKIFLEKWNLKAKILGMRAAARDKKKKRKLKKKNNKLLYEKHFGIADKKNNPNNLGPKFCKSIHEFSYIVSNGTVIKESSSNENTGLNIKNQSSTSSDKVNKVNNLDKKNIGIKKINSVNEITPQNNIKKDNKENENGNGNEDSEEDSGDSLGLDDE